MSVKGEGVSNEQQHGSKRSRPKDENDHEPVKRARGDELYDEFFDGFFEALPAYMWNANYWLALSKYVYLP